MVISGLRQRGSGRVSLLIPHARVSCLSLLVAPRTDEVYFLGFFKVRLRIVGDAVSMLGRNYLRVVEEGGQ